MLVNVKCALLSIGFDDATFVCRKSVSNPTRSLTIWRVNFVVFNGINIISLHFISFSGHPFTCRFILEPKSVLLNEQEQKFNESESAIASMQVSLISACSVVPLVAALQLSELQPQPAGSRLVC